jgi:apolipoprotein N-acyltransferase
VPANNANFNQTMSEQQLAFSKVRAVELDRYTVVASNVGISALVTPDGRELGRTRFFEPAYLDNQVRRKTTLTPAAKWGPIVQGSLVVAAVAVLLAAMLHNGWFTDMNRRLSELAKNVSAAKEKSDDEPSGDDEVADENDVDGVADPEIVEDGEDAALDEGGQHRAPILDQRPEKGDT